MDNSQMELRVQYFDRICIEVLGEFLGEHDFEIEDESELGVTWYRDDCFLELLYYPEDAPNFSPMVSVGLSKYRADGMRVRDGLGLWKVIPDEHPGRNYSTWCFSNEVELRSVIERIRDNLIEPFVLPLILNKSRLSGLLDIQRREVEEEHAKAVQSQLLSDARASYSSGEFEAALGLFSRLDPGAMLGSDIKKMEIARKRTTGSHTR